MRHCWEVSASSPPHFSVKDSWRGPRVMGCPGRVWGLMDAGKKAKKSRTWLLIAWFSVPPKSTVIPECRHLVHSLTEYTDYVPEITDDLLVVGGIEFYPNSVYLPEAQSWLSKTLTLVLVFFLSMVQRPLVAELWNSTSRPGGLWAAQSGVMGVAGSSSANATQCCGV